MLRFRHSFFALALGLLGLAGSSFATNITSSNGANIVSSASGTNLSDYTSWENTLNGAVNDNLSFSGVSSCSDPVNGCSATILNDGMFTVTGSNGVVGSSITTSAAYPLTINMLNTTLLTGLELDLSGNMNVTLALSDGSTVTTGFQSYSSPTFVTFDSPLQIMTATINSTSSGALYDLSWGTVNPAFLPTQPVSGGTGPTGPSDTPEAATLILMGGGLLLMSRWAKRRSWSF